MVDGVLPFQDDLRNGDKGVALLQQGLNDPRQSFRRMLRRIVEQHDAPRLDFTRHLLGNIRSRQVFPIQAVTTGSICLLCRWMKDCIHYFPGFGFIKTAIKYAFLLLAACVPLYCF